MCSVPVCLMGIPWLPTDVLQIGWGSFVARLIGMIAVSSFYPSYRQQSSIEGFRGMYGSIYHGISYVPQYRLFVVFAWLNCCWTSLPLIDFLAHICYPNILIAVRSASAGSESATTTSGETFEYRYFGILLGFILLREDLQRAGRGIIFISIE